MIRFGSSYYSFLNAFGSPKEAKIVEKTSLVAVENEIRENIDFLHPSLAKSLLLGSFGNRESLPKWIGNDFLSD